MIDTHCHLDDAAFDGDRDQVVERARAAGVRGILVPAVRPHTWGAVVELAARYPGVAVAIGIHPQVVPELTADERDADLAVALCEAVDANRACAIAIGECGLDARTPMIEDQEQLFRAHIRAARMLALPLVVHVFHAHDRARRVLHDERAHEVGGVLHSYSGGAELVPIYRDLGFAFSFAGPVTYANARRPVAAAKVIPDELLLAETDAPDQAPEPHRGGRSEPTFVADVIRGLAAARGATADEIQLITTANARRIFARWSLP